MSVLFFQFGDFAGALDRIERGLPETYREQGRTVDLFKDFADEDEVYIVSVDYVAKEPREKQQGGFHFIYLEYKEAIRRFSVWSLLDRLKPSCVILRTPIDSPVWWARARGVPLMPAFADNFSIGVSPTRTAFDVSIWRFLLNSKNIPCVANHSHNASKTLIDVIGLSPERVVPWDRPQIPPNPEPKVHPSGRTFRVFCVGLVQEDKGSGDVLEALSILARLGHKVAGDFMGGGELDFWRARAEELGVEAEFLGTHPNSVARERMRAADAVLTPSRHDYPEGLPNSIPEGLASRTPLVASDHPSFHGRLIPEVHYLSFTAQNPASLAVQLERLIQDPELYERLSRDGASALPALNFGLDWADLYSSFIHDPENRSHWVEKNSFVARSAARR